MADFRKARKIFNKEVAQPVAKTFDSLVESVRRLDEIQRNPVVLAALEQAQRHPEENIQQEKSVEIKETQEKIEECSPPVVEQPSSVPPSDPVVPLIPLQPSTELSLHEMLQMDGFTVYHRFLFSEFRICDFSSLGHGKQALVFHHRHPIFGDIAVKLFKTNHSPLSKYKEREMKYMMKLQGHPGVVRLFGFVYANENSADVLGYVMECVNTSLSDVIHGRDKKTGRLQYEYSVAQAAKWISEVAACLSFFHENNVVHRDLKPKNLLVAWNHPGKPIRVCDLGLSTELYLQEKMTTKIGTPLYMPPEVMHIMSCDAFYDEMADVYSLAITFWELLHRRTVPDFGCDGIEEFFEAITKEALRPRISPSCPEELAILIKRCWATEVSARPKMRQLVEEIEKLLKAKEAWNDILVEDSTSRDEEMQKI